MSDESREIPFVSDEGLRAYICEYTGYPWSLVDTVLLIESEYLLGVGIEEAPAYRLCYYDAAELVHRPRYLDTRLLAEDVERLAGIPQALSHVVFDAEFHFLQMRGLARDPPHDRIGEEVRQPPSEQ